MQNKIRFHKETKDKNLLNKTGVRKTKQHFAKQNQTAQNKT